MNCLGNLLWFLFGGFWQGIEIDCENRSGDTASFFAFINVMKVLFIVLYL